MAPWSLVARCTASGNCAAAVNSRRAWDLGARYIRARLLQPWQSPSPPHSQRPDMEAATAAPCLLSLMLLLIVSAPLPPASALSLPSYVKACSRNDPKLNDCAFKHALEAIPSILPGDRKLNVPKMDPLKVTQIKVRHPGGNVGFGITFNDVDFIGFKDFQLKETNFNLPQKEALIKGSLPVVQMVGKYEVDGKVLLLPIKGSGDANVTLVNLDIAVTVHWELEKRDDGKEYIKPLNSEIKYDMSRAYMHLDGLFGGDKTLGDNMNMFLNENWQDVVKEIGPALAEALSAVVTQILSGITSLVPYDEVFPETA